METAQDHKGAVYTVRRKNQEIDMKLSCVDGVWRVNVFLEINDTAAFHDPAPVTRGSPDAYKSEFSRFRRYRDYLVGYTSKTEFRLWSTEQIMNRLADIDQLFFGRARPRII